MLILTSLPLNSQVNTAYDRSAEKSAWLMPLQSTCVLFCSAIVWGSRKSSRCSASATTIAALPSGVKYMLYGSCTGTFGPRRLPVVGSIGVSELPPSSLLTHSVFRSYDGTTCCEPGAVAKVSMTLYVVGSITDTVPPEWLGT